MPDPGLTDLIAAHQAGERWTDFEYPSIFSNKPFVATTVTKMVNCSCGESMPADDHPAHVALVVEQHANGRIAELEAELEKYHAEERRELEWDRFCAQQDVRCTECGLRYGERKDYTCPHIGEHKYDADELRAALEGEQQ
ncbi:hypothetical protein [Rhodococcus qingshengii]|uniref:hypothetical protein n=1 Tax=Rhodococcus qingshengii TaxID=334542 RepID=UPI001C606163|nr:hypothetical protein [Rhodococcus qingshengii]MBW4813152.1 hypothetical protein [Rhodococcus qingshengii]